MCSFRPIRMLLLALALAILFLAPCALAVNPDPVSPPDNPCAPEAPGVTSADAGGGCPCQQRANQCRAGEDPQGARAETAGGSRWNFLSGRFEQEILLRVGCAGLAMPALRLQHAPGFAPLAHNSPFGDYWHLDAGEYLAPALGGGDGLQWHTLNARARAFRPDGKGGYHSHPDRLTTLTPVAEDGAEFLVMRYGKNESKRYRKVASPDGWAHWRLERFDVPGRASLAFRHDAAGRLSAIERAADGATVYALEIDGATGLCRRITDATGATVAEFSYDARRLLTGIDLGEGRRWAFAYDGEGRMSSKARPNGGVVKYFWGEATGRLCKVEYADGTAQAVEYLRDPAGGAERVTVSHRLPAAALAAFDGRPAPAGRLAALCGGKVDVFTVPAGREQFTEARYADGKVVTKAYDGDGQVTRRDGGCAACDGGKSLVEEYAYQNGRLSSVVYRTREGQVLARESYSYDAGGLLAAATARDGGATRHERDAAGRVTRTVHPDGASEAFAYDGEGRPTSATDELGRVTRYEHDALGRRVATVAPDGGRTVYGYDALGRESSVTYPDGATVTMKYDTIGYLSERTDPLGRVEKWTNDAKGNHLSHTDALGNVTRHEYDGQWRLVKTIFPDGTSERLEYDGDNHVVAIHRRDGSTIRKEYDLWGHVTAEIGPDGARTERQYDADGRLAAVKDAAGRLTVFEHDAWGNVTRTTDALGNATTATFDAMGRRTSFTDALGATTKFAYDRRSRLVSVIDPLGNETKMEHDAAGNLTKLIDANGNASTWEYGPNGMAARLVYPNGDTETYAYDLMRRLVAKTKPDGTVIRYFYNHDGLERIVTPQGEIRYEYDAYGRLKSMTDATLPGGAEGKLSYEHDAFNRLVKVTDHNLGTTIEYAYDCMNRRVSLRMGDKTIDYGYNANGWLATVRRNGESAPAEFAYDPSGLRTRLALPNGVTTVYSHDRAGRLLAVVARDAAGKIVSATEYGLNANGVRTSMRLTLGGVVQVARYGYDALSRLTSEERVKVEGGAETPLFSDGFSYDPLGNRLRRVHVAGVAAPVVTVYGYNAANQLLTETTNGVTTAYGYDKNGNNVSIATPASATSPAQNIAMAYDWLNRQTNWTDGANTETTVFRGAEWHRVATIANGAETRYLYDGDNVLADFAGDNSLTAFYASAGLDQNLSMQTAAGKDYYYVQDGLGSVRALTDANGRVVNQYDFSAFGEPHAFATAETVANRYTYTGRERSAIAGAPMYYRWRRYNHVIGRFFERDCLFEELNIKQLVNLLDDLQKLYVYVNDSPASYIDSYGLKSVPGCCDFESQWYLAKDHYCEGRTGISKWLCEKFISWFMASPVATFAECDVARNACVVKCNEKYSGTTDNCLGICIDDCTLKWANCKLNATNVTRK